LIALSSCKEKNSYGTSLAIDNQLNDSIYLRVYPKESPYSYMTDYKIGESEVENFYWKSGQDEIPNNILNTVFDSIVISFRDKNILFSTDTVIGYNVNLYDENESWDSEIVEYDTPDNFNRNPHEDIVFSFVLNKEQLLND
jgi:hypothetical protein